MLSLYDHLQYGVGQPAPAEVQAALARLPRCYSQDLELCQREFRAARDANRAPALTSTCTADMHAIYRQPELWNAAMDAMPYCPAPPGDSFKLPSCHSQQFADAIEALPFCPASATVVARPITSSASSGGVRGGSTLLLVAGALAVAAVGAYLVLRGRSPARA